MGPGTFYCDDVLRQMLLRDICARAASGSEVFVFQQDSDSAPLRRAKDAAGSTDARFYPTCCLVS